MAFPKKPFNQLLSQNDHGQAAGYYSTTASGSGPDTVYVFDEFGEVFEAFTIAGSVSAGHEHQQLKRRLRILR